jgi:diguanylate cyclase (GGDEF)-like protein
VLVAPPWWTVRRLLYVSAALLLLMLTALIWAVILQRKVRKQTEQIRLTMESEAARERRIAFLEKERGRVLEAINSMLNLDEVLLMILRLISTQLEERSCWCELANGTVVGEAGSPQDFDRAVRRGIYSGAGERLGSLVVSGVEAYEEQAGEALEMGASLAALAIDNRRLYETLIHRSQYDQLTNAANRFLLESRLDEALAHARRSQTHFALVYIDLDQFKQVNDFYGHRVGDLYLQQVAERFSEKLRGMDTLARVGGDEFIALIPVVRSRNELEEITQRLTRCFDSPFRIDSHSGRRDHQRRAEARGRQRDVRAQTARRGLRNSGSTARFDSATTQARSPAAPPGRRAPTARASSPAVCGSGPRPPRRPPHTPA